MSVGATSSSVAEKRQSRFQLIFRITFFTHHGSLVCIIFEIECSFSIYISYARKSIAAPHHQSSRNMLKKTVDETTVDDEIVLKGSDRLSGLPTPDQAVETEDVQLEVK